MNKFRRSRDNKIMLGVFAGLEKCLKAKGYTIDRYCLRSIYILLVLLMPAISGFLLCAYLIVGIILPYEGDNWFEV